MARLLVDTSVFVEHMRGKPIRPGRNQIAYSVITRTELYVGGNERRVDATLEPFDELVVDRDTAERAGRLRRTSAMDLPDALIAATALVHGLSLVTRNVRDFRGVPKLRVRSTI